MVGIPAKIGKNGKTALIESRHGAENFKRDGLSTEFERPAWCTPCGELSVRPSRWPLFLMIRRVCKRRHATWTSAVRCVVRLPMQVSGFTRAMFRSGHERNPQFRSSTIVISCSTSFVRARRLVYCAEDEIRKQAGNCCRSVLAERNPPEHTWMEAGRTSNIGR